MKAVISLSGGMDSVTLLSHVLNAGIEVVGCIGFFYGSKHNNYENKAASNVCEHYGLKYELMDVSNVFRYMSSNLLLTGGAIPEGHYEAATMTKTVVPGRNMIFASILAGIAETRDASFVYMGIHSGDHAIYPDCRPDFAWAMSLAIFHASEGKVSLRYPYIKGNKTTILKEGYQLDTPYHLTRTCYKDQPIACGRCGSCQERLIAFRELGIEDPIEYESRVILPK